MKLLDKVGDYLGTSQYASDKRIAQEFLGVGLSRETYESLRDESGMGTLNQNFGMRARAFRNRKTPGERMQIDISKQVLSHLTKAGVTFDLSEPENKEAVDILSRAIIFAAVNDREILRFGAPYDDIAEIAAKQDRYKEQYPDATDAPLMS